MSNKSGRMLLLATAVLSLFVGGFFTKKQVNQSANLGSSNKVTNFSQDQLAMVEFVKKNPELADELNDLTKLLNVIHGSYVQEKPFEDLLRLAMKGIPESLDPNNTLYIGSEVDAFKGSFGEQNYFGIGAQIDEIGKFILIINVFPNSPAEKAGLRGGDFILKVNGQNIWGLDKEEVVRLIKKNGEGSSVTLEVKRVGSQQGSNVVLVLEKIVAPSLEYATLDKNLDYLKISSCKEETADRFFEAADKLKNSRGLMIDLRNNLGGLVSCAQSILGYFVGLGQPIITTKSRSGESILTSTTTKGLYPKNVVVLIDNNSASAAEIIAGDLKYYKIATLVGVRTYGKQTVQAFFDVSTGLPIFNLSDSSSGPILRLTIAHYFLPDGTNVSENGVVPDIEIEQPSDFKSFEYKTARDVQFQKAIEILTAK